MIHHEVQKVTWAQVGHVNEPGRYLFTFGWLVVTADDLNVWKQFPEAAFTLVDELSSSPVTDDEGEPTEQFHLGAFDVSPQRLN